MSQSTGAAPLTVMTHYTDVFQATLDPAKAERLLIVRAAAMEQLAARVPSFVRADLVRLDERTWLDILVWSAETGAQDAMAAAADIPALVEMHELMDEVTRHEQGVVAHTVVA